MIVDFIIINKQTNEEEYCTFEDVKKVWFEELDGYNLLWLDSESCGAFGTDINDITAGPRVFEDVAAFEKVTPLFVGYDIETTNIDENRVYGYHYQSLN